jgi:hypothetical protein
MKPSCRPHDDGLGTATPGVTLPQEGAVKMGKLCSSTVCAFALLVAGCRLSEGQIPDGQKISLPSSPDGALRAEAEVWSEAAAFRIARPQDPWPEYDWLSFGQCSNAVFYWAGQRTAVVAYDKAEISYFVDLPRYWGGSAVRICNRLTTECPPPISAVRKIPGCDDHSM